MKWDGTEDGKSYRKKYHTEYYLRNKKKLLSQQRERLLDPLKKEQKNKKDRERHFNYKSKIYALLGGAKCKYCGYDKDPRALQLDHINGDGSIDRKRFHSSAVRYWMEYKDNLEELKKKFQVLCANCNAIKKFENNEVAYR